MKRIAATIAVGVLWLAFLGNGQASGLDTPVVLFDQGHGQAFLVERHGDLQLSGLGELIGATGSRIRIETGSLRSESFEGVQALVISGPFKPFASAELDLLESFVERGGRLAVMLHIGPPAVSLLQRFGVAVSSGVIRESEGVVAGNPLDFRVASTSDHPLLAGLEDFNLYGGWALLPEGAGTRDLARTGSGAWVDLDGDASLGGKDVVQSFSVAVVGRLGEGEFVVFGDDALFQNRFLTGNNRLLGQNLARWLTSASD